MLQADQGLVETDNDGVQMQAELLVKGIHPVGGCKTVSVVSFLSS